MAGTPLQSPFVSLVQRIALFQSFTVSAGSSSAAKIITGTFQGAGSAALIPLQGQQAFRIRSLDLGLSDFAQTGNLTALNFTGQLTIHGVSETPFRFFPCQSTMGLLLGQAGLSIHFEDEEDELTYWNDYLSLPSGTPNVTGLGTGVDVTIVADITNTNAGNLPVTMKIVALVEIYQITTGKGLASSSGPLGTVTGA